MKQDLNSLWGSLKDQLFSGPEKEKAAAIWDAAVIKAATSEPIEAAQSIHKIMEGDSLSDPNIKVEGIRLLGNSFALVMKTACAKGEPSEGALDSFVGLGRSILQTARSKNMGVYFDLLLAFANSGGYRPCLSNAVSLAPAPGFRNNVIQL